MSTELISDGVVPETVGEGFYSARELTYIRPQKRRISEYEAVICHAQPDLDQFDSGGWYLLRPDGLGCQDARTTALKHPNWFEYRDPSSLWQRPYIKLQAQQERSIQGAITSAKANGSFSDIAPGWLDLVSCYYEAYASFQWGMFKAHAFVTREALSDTLSMTYTFSGMDRLRHQQDIALYSLDLHEHAPGYTEGAGAEAWLNDPVCQGARRLVERLLSLRDWGEMVLMTNLVVEPLFTALLGSEFFRHLAPLHGDVVIPVIEMTAEADRLRNRTATQALIKLLTADTDRSGRPVPAARNRELIQGWVDSWYPDALAAVDAFLPVFDAAPAGSGVGERARQRVVSTTADILEQAGLQVPAAVTS
ncbi:MULTISPECIES: aromatic/alkene monooxygenase hydroxylase subunit beta [Rhodococcus]|uniref:aromatic/alkene monooxygenase hydroxylase subunit beta n=1 Tax=Rhodococcus TaxID=1827 RepID=UPI002953A59A|nr:MULTISPECIES: aromatic/alkene monooxygenase hydroxylase subunit beta [Rhodococcus]MDV7246316.1 aromatic/alkene monooxygenase hydroxylase subunit beta [Rhodococcus oxybenzonivorans]MDV7337402.1 aromatic/alkene monooxygenase hydroxylase subunit beta [Rhodococcus oxybenzonivorans]MDV7348072.1 aromatic/alkene monooxygenase hydroxylase subunit beta [Rhodococcus oxybenzonivorans]MDV8031710.1 aromatic/alkene monooxygenase hydroxylase subunit beta [Rhodococcus sp. IEGM 27]